MKLFDTSIRAQLFLMALIVALPTAGIILYSGFEARREAIAHAKRETQVLTDRISYQQQSQVASAKQLLNGLAQLPDIRSRNTQKIQGVLTDILAMNPQYLNIFIVDRQGEMWVSAVPSTAPIPISDRRHFINAMTTGRFSSGEFTISKLLGEPTIGFGYPFRNAQGEWDGVIVIDFDLGYGDRLLESSRLPSGSNYLLIDHQGLVMGRGIDPTQFLGKPVGPEMLRQMRGLDTDTFISEGFLDGIRRFVTYRKLYLEGEQTPYMYIRTSIPVETALGKANMALGLNLILFSTILLFGFAAAWVIGKRSILERISTLQAASQRLAAGDFRVRVGELVKGGELGSLGESFDAMAAELHQQRETLEAKAMVLENMAEGVSEYDQEGKLLFTNPAFEALFGYGKGELLGKDMKILLADATGSTDELCARIIQHLHAKPLWSGELHIRKKDGTSFHTYARISRIPETERFISVLEDISERKELERLKEEMITGVSHDMRSPLIALLGFHEFLAENSVDEAMRAEVLSTMHQATTRLDQLIGNFLDLHKIKAQQMVYDFAGVDIAGLLRESSVLFSNASRDHRIVIDSLPDLPQIYGDEARLHQVMNNLVSNAIKYSPDGGEIVLGAQRLENTVTLWVRDHGIGIPTAALEKIFDRFYRVDNSGNFPGTGLGLALVREIVKSHGGSVRVESSLGKGSTFYVSFPIAPASPTGTENTSALFREHNQ